MPILEARFRPPHPLDPRNGDIVGQIRTAKKIDYRVLPVGRHDVTPPEWRDPNYRYLVDANASGTGGLHMQPRHPGSAMEEIPGTVPGLGLEHERYQPLIEGSASVLIAGGHEGSPTGVALFAIISWVAEQDASLS